MYRRISWRQVLYFFSSKTFGHNGTHWPFCLFMVGSLNEINCSLITWKVTQREEKNCVRWKNIFGAFFSQLETSFMRMFTPFMVPICIYRGQKKIVLLASFFFLVGGKKRRHNEGLSFFSCFWILCLLRTASFRCFLWIDRTFR